MRVVRGNVTSNDWPVARLGRPEASVRGYVSSSAVSSHLTLSASASALLLEVGIGSVATSIRGGPCEVSNQPPWSLIAPWRKTTLVMLAGSASLTRNHTGSPLLPAGAPR